MWDGLQPTGWPIAWTICFADVAQSSAGTHTRRSRGGLLYRHPWQPLRFGLVPNRPGRRKMTFPAFDHNTQMDKRLDAQSERRKSGSIMTTAPVAALPTTTTTAGSDKHGF